MNISTSTSATNWQNNAATGNNKSSALSGMPASFLRWFFMLLMVAFAGARVNAQSIVNYTFGFSNTASLTDMSSGTTVLAGLETGTYYDSKASVVTDMPIPFVYMGVLQTKFSCNSNGQLRFGTTAISSTSITAPAASVSYLAPMAGDNAMSASGVVHYKVTGSAPNRVMTVSWDSILVPFNSTTNTLAGVVQARLYETTGVIEYVYGNVYNNSASAQSRSIFLCSSNTATTNGYVTVGATPTFTPAAANVTNSFAGGPSYIANLSSTSNGSRWMYSWTPPSAGSLADPTSLNITNVGLQSMTLNWTAASPTTGILGYAILVSTDGGTTYSPAGSVAVGTNTFNVTGLTPNTVYTFAVHSFSEGALSTNPATATQATNACSISGVKTVGPGGDYERLGLADSALVANGLSGAVILELNASYTSTGETFPISLKSVPCASATNTITIRPALGATGRTITSANTTGTLLLDSADYYIIDGRPGGIGSSDMVISNSSTGYAIRFVNDATNNTVRYVTASSGATSTTSGVIVFSTTGVASGIGNDNNTIDNCDLNGGGLVSNVIYASGSTTTLLTYNNGIVISNNKIRDMFSATAATNGMLIATGNSDWTISGNSIYQTASRTYTTANTHTGINISTSTVNNMSITNNYIGGTAVNAGGTAYTIGGTIANRYRAISLTVGTTTASSVQGNTITNFSFASSSGATTVGGPWTGIYVSAGNVNIGTTTGNTIGAATGNGSIVATTTTTAGISSGIFIDGGTIHNIANNIIGSINTAGSTTSVSHGFTGIHIATSTTPTIYNNTIGSTSTANSINSITASTNASVPVVTGILQAGSGTARIYGNTIANLNSAYVPATSTAAIMRGIYASNGIDSIAGNTVRNITCATASTGSGNNASITGIGNFSSVVGANWIRGNTVHSLVNSNNSVALHINGIYYNGPSSGAGGVIEKNLVHYLTSPSTLANVNGITSGGQTATYQNNMVRLGLDATGADIATTTPYNGFLEIAGTNTVIHNTVYIGGTVSGTGATSPTYAYNNNAALTSTRVIRNNIFINARGNSTTGSSHYAFRNTGTATGLTINNNIYRSTGTGAVLASFNGADQANLAALQAADGQDANSLTSDPCLANPTAATPDLHLTDCAGAGSPADGVGFNLGLADDYDSDVRANLTPTDIGADAGNYGVIGVDVGISALVAPATPTGCLTAAETVTVTLKNYGVNTIDFSVNPVTVTVTATGGYSSNIVVNSGTLASNGTQNVTLPATIDMSVGGTYTFNASAVVTGDVNTANDALPPANVNYISLGGSYNVGAGGNYLTLTAAIAAYNAATCFTAPVVFNLTDATYGAGETFPMVINANAAAGANTLTIRPAAGTAVTISGTSGATASALIKLNGADNIIIDGINTGGASLTIENTSTTTGTATIWLASTGAGAGATNNTIQNTNIKAGIAQNGSTSVTYGIVMAGGTLSATLTSVTAGDDNDNNTFTGNTFTKVRYGIFTRGGATTNPNTGTVITNNIIGPAAFGADQIGQGGVLIREEDGINISGNTIRFVGGDYANTTGGADRAGIAMGTTLAWTPTSVYVKNATITRNLIHDIRDERTFSAVGIIVAGADGGNATNNTIANNMISNITANGTSSDQTVGIGISAGNGDKVVFNSISLTGDTDPNASATAPTISNFGISISALAATNLDLRNNIVHMDLSSSSASSIENAAINIPASYVWGTGGSNYNNFSVVGSNTQSSIGCVGGSTFHTTLADWQTASSQDANTTDVIPVFTSATDLHLVTNSNPLLDDTGTPVSGITGDYDNDTRDVTTPDRGADEFSAPVGLDISAFALVAPGTSGCYGTTETVTVRIKNNSPVLMHDLSTDNVTVAVTATGGYTSNIVLSTGTIAPLATMDVTLPATIDMSVNGAYSFDASAVITTGGPDLNLDNDTLATVTRTGVPVAVGTVSASNNAYCITPGRPTMTLSSAAGGTIQWQVSTDGTNWTNVGSDSLQYTPATDITDDTTYFKAIVTCTASATSLTSNIDTVLYNNPSVTGTTPNTRCGTGPITLGATGSAGSTIKWYTASTGGTAVATGTSYSPTVSATTSFWVSASQGGGGNGSVGAVDNTLGAGAASALTHYLIFDVLSPMTLASVYVYPGAAGDVILNISNSSGTVLTTITYPVTAGDVNNKTLIPINYAMTPGTAYRIGWATGGVSMYRNSAGYSYPYTLAGVVSITGNSFDPAYYYYAYDWVVSTGCESARTEVVATVNAAPTISLNASSTSICAGQSTNLTVSSGYDPNYNYTWSPATTPATGAAVTATPAATGFYVVTATDNLGFGTYAGCVTKDSVNITVNPLPEPIVMNPATSATACVGGSVTLNASSGQSVSGTLGTQSTTIGGNTGNPYRSGYGANSISKNQILILASELSALGFTTGNITSLGFTVTSITTGTEIYNLTISMNHTALSALTTTAETNIGSTVYTHPGPFFTPVVGVNAHNFQTPFAWDGVSNVLVTVCQNLQTASTTTTVATFTTPAIANTQAVGTSVNCTTTTATSTAASRPVMTIVANTASPITWSPSTDLNTTTGNTVISTPTTSPIKYYATATLGACTRVDSVTVSLSDLAVSASTTANVTCFGGNNGSVTGTATGGSTSYTYTIAGPTVNATGATTGVFTGLTAGSYTVTVNDGTCNVTSSSVTVTEPTQVTSSISAFTDPTCNSSSPSPLFEDGSVTATAGGGTGPYTYVINGPTVNTTGATTGIFTGLTAGSYTVTVTDFYGCQATSAAQVLNNPAAPAVSAANNGPVCAGSNATLTATPGTYVSYSWTGPGTINNANTDVATAVAPANNDVFTVLITDVNGCTNTANTTVSVTDNDPVSVSLAVSPATEICDGSSATFTATPTNGGATPNYEFFVNAVSVQNGSSNTYTTTTLVDQDVVTVVLTSSITCTTGSPATSNAITMTVSGFVNADVTLAASPSGTVCSGTNVTYTATPTAGGPSPTYEFFVNAVSVQNSASATYTYAPANGDQVYVVMTSSFGCALNNPATSNTVTASVNPTPAAPTVTAGGPTTFCNGGSVVLTSDSSGVGNQWYIDNVLQVGETNPTITATTSGSYTVVYTEGGCSSVASTPVVVTVNANPVATITGTASYCTGGSTVLSAATSTAGSGTITGYQWVLNGVTNLGTAVTETISATGSYTVIVTNSNGCSTTSAATVVTENTPPTAGISASCTTLSPGETAILTATPATGVTYSWSLDGGPELSTANPYTTAGGATGTYTVTVTDVNGCTGTANVVISARTGALVGGNTYNIPESCGTGFPSIASAVSYLNANGVTGTGTVTFNVAAGHTETAPNSGIGLNMCALGGSLQTNATLGITFQKSGVGANPLITAGTGAGATDYIFALIGADYVTINGIDLQANVANTTAAQKTEIGYALLKCSGTDGAQYNTIENSTVTLDKTNSNGSVGIYGASADAALAAVVTTATTGANSNNIFRNNTVTNTYIGIQMSGFADVTPFAYYDQDNEIGQTGAGNTITNIGGGSAFVAGISTSNQNDLKVVANNINSGASAGTGNIQGISVGSASNANTDIIGNTVTVNASASATGQMIGILNNSGSRFGRPASASVTNTVNILNNTVQNSTYPATGTGSFWLLYTGSAAADTLGAHTLNITGNQLLNNTQASSTNTGTMFGIISQKINDFGTISNNTITGNAMSGNVANPLRTIVTGLGGFSAGTVPYAQNLSVTGNTITGNTAVTTTAVIDGIAVEAYTGNSPQVGTTVTISNNTVGSATYAQTTGTYNGVATTTGISANAAVTMSGNTVSNVTRNAATTGIFNGVRSLGTSVVSNTMNNNTVSNISMTGATSASFNGITHAGSSTLTTTMAMNGNTVSGCTMNGTGTMTLMDGGNAVVITMNNNQVTNNQKTGASGIVYCTRAATGQVTFNGNTISNNSIPTTSGTSSASLYGYYNLGSPTVENYTNNNINNLSIGGTSTSTSSLIYGMYSNSVAASVKEYSGNTIHTMSMAVPGNLYGIINALGTVNIFKNKIYNLSSSASSSTAQVEGIRLSSGTNTKVYNNIIGDLRSTATTGTDAVRGIASLIATTSSTLGIYFNTIWLNGTSSAATFGNSGIFITTSTSATTAALSLSNNLVINTSTPKGTARAVAYRRSSTTLTNFTNASNNNLYYVTAGANNHVYSDGSNHLDLAAYKAFAGISPRETNSQTENVTFVSTTGSDAGFLHIDPVAPTLVESGAINIAGITDDFDSDIRQGNPGYTGVSLVGPDIGADELDATPPPCAGAVGGTASAAAFSCTSNTATVMTVTGASTGGGITYQWEVSSTGGGVGFAPVVGGSGANTLSYTSATGLALGTYYYRLSVTCSTGPVTAYSNEITVEVRPTPTASASNSGPVCSGTSLTLTGTTDIGTTFAWSGPGGFTSTLQSPVFTTGTGSNGVYTFTATSAGGCSVSATTNATVNITPSPVTVTPAVSILCEGSSQVLTATGGQLGAVTEMGTQQNQNATSGYPAPYSAYYGSQRMQTLIRASELTAAGFYAGTQFTAINFPVVSLSSNWGTTITSCNDFQIKAGFVDPGTVNTMTAFQAGLTQVVAPTNYTPVVGYNNEHLFSTPLTWNGTDNLIIETTFGNNFAGTVNESVIQYNTTTSYQSTITYRADNVTAAAAAAATTVSVSSSARPDFKLTGSAGAVLTYNWSPATGLSSTTGASVTASPTSSQTYTVTTTNAGCSGTPGTASITINPVPAGASIAGTTAVCQNATQPLVTFSANVGTAPYTFTYTINGGAPLTATTPSGVNPQSVSVSVPTGTPGTYVYAITGVTDQYCTNNTVTGSATVTVNALPDATFTGLAGPYCANAAAVTLTSTQTSGTFSGPGITDNGNGTASFNPATAGAGTHSISFSYTDGNSCTNSSSQNVTVNALPTVSFTGLPSTLCVHAAAITLTGNQAPNGTFTGAGITDNANGTASFNPATAGVGGPYTITYSYTDGNGCTNSSSQTITITENFQWVNLQWPPSGSICEGTPGGYAVYGQAYKAGVTEAAGAGAGVTAELGWSTTNTNPNTWTNWQPATFNVQVGNNDEFTSSLSLPAGTYYYTFRYSYNGCGYQYGGYSAGGGNFWDGATYVSGVLTVNALPTVSFTGLSASYCVNAGAVVLTGNQAPNGTFSGPGITDNADGTATFNPATAGVGGPYSITYTYNNGTCSNSSTQTVTVNALPVVSFSGLAASYCTTDAAVTLTGSPVGGTFSGPGISGNQFDPASAGAGTHSITYTYTDGNGCTNSSSQNVTVTVCATFTTLNLTAFLEGFYYDINTMRANIYDLGISTDPTETDTITVNLWAPTSLSNPNPDYSVLAVVHTDGTATMQFPAAVTGNSYYIAVKHRNHMETWSLNPVAFTATTSYNFTTSQSQAYDDGVNPPMASVAGGKFAFYGGDVDQSGGIDATDLGNVDNDVNLFAFGYNPTDATGDGGTDASDLQIVENNSQLFLFYARPY